MSPYDGAAAWSDYTPIKQHELARFLRLGAPIYRNVANKWHEPLTIWDIYAGPGIVHGEVGSPILLARALSGAAIAGARLITCEVDFDTITRLRSTLPAHPDILAAHLASLRIECTNNAEVLLNATRNWSIGLLYADPNGRDRFHLDGFRHFAAKRPRVDWLLHFSLNAHKRAGREAWQETEPLLAFKDHWCIRHRVTRNSYQFVFLLGSNWHDKTIGNNWADRLSKLGWQNADEGMPGRDLLRSLCGADVDDRQERLDV